MIAAGKSRKAVGGDARRSRLRAPFLRRYFAMQSHLWIGVDRGRSRTRSAVRQSRMLTAYGVLCLFALTVQAAGHGGSDAVALGLVFPGAGFLLWADPGQAGLAVGLAAGALLLFGLALAKWFATGNVVLPPLLWLASAGAAARPDWFALDDRLTQPASGYLVPVLLAAGWAARLAMPGRARTAPSPSLSVAVRPIVAQPLGEIAPDDLRRLRLLADRALQTVAAFDGFEWRDQFQTAAVRYQVNFMAYALAMARARHLPAATGWLAEAQSRLLTKQGEPRLWRHWALENAWGNLRIGRDPIPRGNIMSTGFLALQMALGEAGASLDLRRHGESWRRYDLREVAAILAGQYREAPYGLLSCEPHWIYPLCNLITACGLRAADRRTGRDHWPEIATRFGEKLLEEFMTRAGDFVAFRSSLTGFAAPRVGGAVMQAFPCLFLNALYPDLAAEHWQRVLGRVRVRGWRKALWPIDVGNYGFSRAAGYAASAAAAVEMGDRASARDLLDLLDADCPGVTLDGVTHRPGASLWAHALELTARLGCADGFRCLVETPDTARSGPHLAEADYPDVLVAAARREGETLHLVLRPGDQGATRPIAVAGLRAGRHYHTGLAGQPFAHADETGRAVISVPLHDRVELRVAPVV